MAFNADQFLQSLEHPEVTINGVTHTGRILSIEQWLPYYNRLQKLAGKNTAEYIGFMRDYLKEVFPQTSFIPWRKPVWKIILNHPSAEAMVTSFLELQMAGMKGEPRQQQAPED